MIRVDTNAAFLVAEEARKRQNSRKTSARSGVQRSQKPKGFQELLGEVLPMERAESRSLHEMWKELPAVEQELLDRPSIENLERYKRLVFGIARGVLKRNIRAVQLERKSRFHEGEKIPLTLHKFIDQRLKKMAEAILSPNVPAFHLLRTTMEIRGILLDYQK